MLRTDLLNAMVTKRVANLLEHETASTKLLEPVATYGGVRPLGSRRVRRGLEPYLKTSQTLPQHIVFHTFAAFQVSPHDQKPEMRAKAH